MKQNYIMKDKWDVLIILDACRFDYFSKHYRPYFTGKLEKRISLGSCTSEWCVNSFTDHYPDTIYISANPYINSKMKVSGFEGKNHFEKVIDVWKSEWDEKLGTVLPNKVNGAAIKIIKAHPGERFIIHYLQPHAPYLSNKYQTQGFLTPDLSHDQVLKGLQGTSVNKLKEKMVNGIGYLLFKLKLLQNAWEFRAKLKMPPATPMDAFRRKWGVDGLKEAYKENLRIVFEYVNELVHRILKGRPELNIAITSDHGEMLGENGNFSHHSGSNNPILTEVPYFTLKSASTLKTKNKLFDANEEIKIKATIQDLKKDGKV